MKINNVGRLIFISMLGASLLFFAPRTASATPEIDQTPATEDEIAEAESSGLIHTDLYQDPEAVNSQALEGSSKAIRTIGGSTRYETSALQALDSFMTSEWVIIAGGESYADSISAAGLAGALKCPIILTSPKELLGVTSEAIAKLGARKVIVLGGTEVVSESVFASLEKNAVSIVRLFGNTRYETQLEVFKFGVANKLWGSTAVVAYGENFADALSISPLSYKLRAPVFYTKADGSLPDDQLAAVKSSGVTEIVVTGKNQVVSDSARKKLRDVCPLVELGGNTRYETSEVIAKYCVGSRGMTWNGTAYASGETPFDALGGGPAQGNCNSVIVLKNDTRALDASVPYTSTPSSIKFFGGQAVFTGAFKSRMALASGYSLSDIDGLLVYVDAGHGGGDPGANGCGYNEEDLTYELAHKVADRLRASGTQVYVMDSTDKKLNYKYRHPDALNMGANAYVSIHFNAGGGTGTESYVHSLRSAQGSLCLQSSTHSSLINALGLRDRGMKSEQFAVVSGPVPSVLLEVCFIDNWDDMNTYIARKDSVALGIASGILSTRGKL